MAKGSVRKKFIAKIANITLKELLDMWAEEKLKVGTLSNGTVENYLGTISMYIERNTSDYKTA